MIRREISPDFEQDCFTCPHCGMAAYQRKNSLVVDADTGDNGKSKKTKSEPIIRFAYGERNKATLKIATCDACGSSTLWINEMVCYREEMLLGKLPPGRKLTYNMINPRVLSEDEPHPDTPSHIRSIINEAREVFEVSPRSSLPLIRLAYFELIKDKDVGAKGRNQREKIKNLIVCNYPEFLQVAGDALRILINDEFRDVTLSTEKASYYGKSLFLLFNELVMRVISTKKRGKEVFTQLKHTKVKPVAVTMENSDQSSVVEAPAEACQIEMTSTLKQASGKAETQRTSFPPALEYRR